MSQSWALKRNNIQKNYARLFHNDHSMLDTSSAGSFMKRTIVGGRGWCSVSMVEGGGRAPWRDFAGRFGWNRRQRTGEPMAGGGGRRWGKGEGWNVPPANRLPAIRGTVGARRTPAYLRVGAEILPCPSKNFKGRPRSRGLFGRDFPRQPAFWRLFYGLREFLKRLK